MPKVNDEIFERFLDLSGPHVWPSLSAIDVVDRLIFQRPEMKYLQFCEELERSRATNKDNAEIRIMAARTLHGIKKRTRVASFIHPAVKKTQQDSEKLATVKNFLSKIRKEMLFHFPNEPVASLTVEIWFIANEKKPPIRQFFSRKWI